MSAGDHSELKALIALHSAYYGQQIPGPVIAMYAEDLADLPIERVRQAFQEIRRDPRVTRFPLPATIRDRITPANTDEADARDAAARICAAVNRVGPYEVSRARAYVGELAWQVVTLQGGWEYVCELLTNDNLPQMQAQWRELAKAELVRGRTGHRRHDQELVESKPRGGALSSMSDVFKQLSDRSRESRDDE